MQERTWPYGTIKTVEVLSREVVRSKGGKRLARPCEVLMVKEKRTSEGHILMGTGWNPSAAPGDTGIITFMEGGPRGGYWQFTPDRKSQTG